MGVGGGSCYLGMLLLSGTSLLAIRPTVLILNIIVGLVCTVRFLRAGLVSWRSFWPLAVTSCPASFIGGSIGLASTMDRVLIGLVLLYGAVWLLTLNANFRIERTAPIQVWVALPLGATIGLVSGLSGIGGGIFLSSALRFMNRTDFNQVRGMVSAFVLANSLSGLLPRLSGLELMPDAVVYWAPAALVGAWVGTELQGPARQMIMTQTRFLSLLLVVAEFKLVL